MQLAALVHAPLPLDVLQRACTQGDWITFLMAAQVAAPLVSPSTLAALAHEGLAGPMAWHVIHVLETAGAGSTVSLTMPALTNALTTNTDSHDMLTLLSQGHGMCF